MRRVMLALCVAFASDSVIAGIIETGTTWTASYDGTIDTWTAPVAGLYTFTVYGAQGGSAQRPGSSVYVGGLGSGASAEYFLSAGTTLDVLVGGQGGFGDSYGGAGGGGGSYVALQGVSLVSDIPLLVGGGGGGAESNYNNVTAGNGRTTPGTGTGGRGSAGYRGSGAGGGGGGAGFSNSGGNGVTDSQFGYQGGGGGIAFTLGGAGGYGFPSDPSPSGVGGFGGGGGGGQGVDPGGAGGGGGYDGGNAGSGNGDDFGSQGGTAYYNLAPPGTTTFVTGAILSASEAGNGSVSIMLDSTPTPEPCTAALVAIGATCYLGYRFRRRAPLDPHAPQISEASPSMGGFRHER